MKRDPALAHALAQTGTPDLPEGFAVRMERLAYEKARAARPSAWVERGFAGGSALALAGAAWLAQRMNSDWVGNLPASWAGTQPFASSSSSGAPALILAALLWLLMQHSGAISGGSRGGRS